MLNGNNKSELAGHLFEHEGEWLGASKKVLGSTYLVVRLGQTSITESLNCLRLVQLE